MASQIAILGRGEREGTLPLKPEKKGEGTLKSKNDTGLSERTAVRYAVRSKRAEYPREERAERMANVSKVEGKDEEVMTDLGRARCGRMTRT